MSNNSRSRSRSSDSSSSSSNDSDSASGKESESRSPPKKQQKRQQKERPTDKGAPAAAAAPTPAESRKRAGDDDLLTRTGGAYIPPAKLRALQAAMSDKSSEQYQRVAWEALKKTIHSLINSANVTNLSNVVRQLLSENLVRGRGLFVRSLMSAQAASPVFTPVFAGLVAVVNTRFPQIGELALKRLIEDVKKAFRRNNKEACLAACSFLAHLVNQRVAHEVLALEVLALLLNRPTDGSVEIAVGLLKEVGARLLETTPRGLRMIFDQLRGILHEAVLDKRVQYMIETLFQIRQDEFKLFPAIQEALDLVEEEDQVTHLLSLEDEHSTEQALNVFRYDPDFLTHEEEYKAIQRELLGEGSDSGDSSGSSDSGSDSDSDEADEEGAAAEPADPAKPAIDQTQTQLVQLRKTIYLTVQSSLDYEEAAHKLRRLQLKPGEDAELASMILDCCAQLRTYEKFYGLMAQRFCQLDRVYVQHYERIFNEQYTTIHRLETMKLRNVARFFAHLLYTDSISWGVLQCVQLTEEGTTSSSRIFLKILFQDLAEHMGLERLCQRFTDCILQVFFEGLFPRDHPRNTRFSINYFKSIGLNGVTLPLRQWYETAPKTKPESSSSESSSSSSSESSSSETSSSSDEDEAEERSGRRRQQKRLRDREIKREPESVAPSESDRQRHGHHPDVRGGERGDYCRGGGDDGRRENRDKNLRDNDDGHPGDRGERRQVDDVDKRRRLGDRDDFRQKSGRDESRRDGDLRRDADHGDLRRDADHGDLRRDSDRDSSRRDGDRGDSRRDGDRGESRRDGDLRRDGDSRRDGDLRRYGDSRRDGDLRRDADRGDSRRDGDLRRDADRGDSRRDGDLRQNADRGDSRRDGDRDDVRRDSTRRDGGRDRDEKRRDDVGFRHRSPIDDRPESKEHRGEVASSSRADDGLKEQRQRMRSSVVVRPAGGR